jgi:hypothetical protein
MQSDIGCKKTPELAVLHASQILVNFPLASSEKFCWLSQPPNFKSYALVKKSKMLEIKILGPLARPELAIGLTGLQSGAPQEFNMGLMAPPCSIV